MTTAVRRKQIVDAVRHLIIKRGAEHVTVRGIAQEVGISEAAIYRHFRSKKDVLCLLLDEIEQDLIDDVGHERNGTITTLSTVDAVLRNHLSAIEKRRGVRFQVIAEIISLGDRSLNRRALATVDKYIACLEQLLSECQGAGAIRKDVDVKSTATLLFCAVQGIVNIWALSGYSFDPIERYEPMVAIVLKAVEPR
jgi:AcrR family transcriptional regulator